MIIFDEDIFVCVNPLLFFAINLNQMKLSLFPYVFFAILTACSPEGNEDYNKLAARIEKGINVVVEIPAGTNHKIEYQAEKGVFANDLVDGKNRVIDFLPYPGNYGFIPSTFMDPKSGGDGDALDVLVIGESQATGSVLKALPVAVLLLKDKGELDSKIIAVPLDLSKRTMKIDNFKDLLIEYDAAKRIIEAWFLNYKGFGEMELISWQDEAYAWKEIERWEVIAH